MKWFKVTEINIDTTPTYHDNNLPERYNEALLKKAKSSMKEKISAVKAIGSYYIKMFLAITAFNNQFMC